MNKIELTAQTVRSLSADAVLITFEESRTWVSGLVTSWGYVVITKDADAYFLADSRYLAMARNSLSGHGFQIIDITSGYLNGGYLDNVNDLIRKHGIQRIAVEDNHLSYNEYMNYQERIAAEVIPAGTAIDVLRAFVPREDMLKVRAAQEIAEKSLEMTLSNFKIGMTEQEFMAELIYHMIRYGADGYPFDPEILSGEVAAMPHGRPSQKPIREGEVLLTDFGASKDGFWSDCSRTFAVGYATDEMEEVYHTVLNAQVKAIEHYAPGVNGRDLDAVARNYILGSGVDGCYQHSLGHSVGVVKAMSSAPVKLANPTSDSVFAIGDIMTFEPGIYQEGKLGCRIEDMVWLDESGDRVNLATLPKEELIVLK